MRLPRVRFTVGRLMVAVALAGILSIYLGVIRPHQQHLTWYRSVEQRIARLAAEQPRDLTESQWAACIHWTWQLHTNWGPAFRDPTASERFLVAFDRRLGPGVGLETIDWVWDEYCLQTPGGRSYSERFRPTTRERLEETKDWLTREPWQASGWREHWMAVAERRPS